MKEYVILVSEHCSELKITLKNILNGKIQDFKYKSTNKMNSSGGALAKSTSKPKDLNSEANK